MEKLNDLKKQQMDKKSQFSANNSQYLMADISESLDLDNPDSL